MSNIDFKPIFKEEIMDDSDGNQESQPAKQELTPNEPDESDPQRFFFATGKGNGRRSLRA